MKVLLVNSVCGIRSTGRICTAIADLLMKSGDESLIVYGRAKASDDSESISLKIGNRFTNLVHYFNFMLHDDDGKGSYFITKKLIRKIKKFKPDIVHLHNIHGHYINYNALLKYLAKYNIPTVFSLYDCWQFTGNCYHFDYIGCEKWKTGCEKCPNQTKYPFDKFWIDRSKRNYKNKKKRLGVIKNKVFLPGSYWLESVLKQSFLKDEKIITVQSGLDLTRYSYIESDVKQRYGIENDKVVLCVASTWSRDKGVHFLDTVAESIKGKAKLVVIGEVRSKIAFTSDNIIHIEQTNSIQEMCEWYSTSDVYLNLTLQETLGLTNVEALACGTPVITFDSGGCSECISEECGFAVERDNITEAIEKTLFVVENQPFSKEACISHSKKFDKNNLYQKYLEVYQDLLAKSN